MQDLLITISAIALVDSINPNAVAVQVYLLSTPKPTRRSIAFIAGDYLAAWVAGLLIAFGMLQLVFQVFDRLGNLLYVIQFILGITLIIAGYYVTKVNHQTVNRPKSLRARSTFLLGLTMAFVETPTALPYLAAIERITRTKPDILELMVLLAWYCLIFILPLIGLLTIHIVLKNHSPDVLDRVQKIVNQWFPKLFQFVLIALGIVLVIDCFTQLFGVSVF